MEFRRSDCIGTPQTLSSRQPVDARTTRTIGSAFHDRSLRSFVTVVRQGTFVTDALMNRRDELL
jgi:hypothetical protein